MTKYTVYLYTLYLIKYISHDNRYVSKIMIHVKSPEVVGKYESVRDAKANV